MSTDFFPPRFENPFDYIEILLYTRNRLRKLKFPFELIRTILLNIRNQFLEDLEIEIKRGQFIQYSELVHDVEYKRAVNRSISMKAMMNLIKLKIGDDCSICVPENHNVPLDLKNLQETYITFINVCVFRIHYAVFSSYWTEQCDPECKYLICAGDVYTLKDSEI